MGTKSLNSEGDNRKSDVSLFHLEGKKRKQRVEVLKKDGAASRGKGKRHRVTDKGKEFIEEL